MTWWDVYVLFLRIPERQPRGSPQNKERGAFVNRWMAAKRAYEAEHNVKWLTPNKRLADVAPGRR